MTARPATESRVATLALTSRSKFYYDRLGNRYRRQWENPTGSPTTNWVEGDQIDRHNRFESGRVTADPKFRVMQNKYDGNGRMVDPGQFPTVKSRLRFVGLLPPR